MDQSLGVFPQNAMLAVYRRPDMTGAPRGRQCLHGSSRMFLKLIRSSLLAAVQTVAAALQNASRQFICHTRMLQTCHSFLGAFLGVPMADKITTDRGNRVSVLLKLSLAQ